MKKKSLFIFMATFILINISSAMMNPCIDIYNGCVSSNPFNPEEGVHETQAWYGYWQGCLSFLDACFEQN